MEVLQIEKRIAFRELYFIEFLITMVCGFTLGVFNNLAEHLLIVGSIIMICAFLYFAFRYKNWLGIPIWNGGLLAGILIAYLVT